MGMILLSMNGRNYNEISRWLPFALSLSKGVFLFVLQEAQQSGI